MEKSTGVTSESTYLLTGDQGYTQSQRQWGLRVVQQESGTSPLEPRAQGESPKALQAQRIEETPAPVQKEAKKVNWYIFTALLVLTLPLLGVGGWAYLIYKNCSSAEAQNEQVNRSAPSNPAGISSILPRDAKVRSKPETAMTFSQKSSEVYISSFMKEYERTRLTGDKVIAQAEFESYGRLLAERKPKLLELRELIPVVEGMSIFSRLRAGHPSASDLKKEAKELEEEIRGYDQEFSRLQNDLKTIYVEHPRFSDTMLSHEGFPFQIIFDGEELKQGYSYDTFPTLPRNDFRFRELMSQKLMEWSGEQDIDPVGENIPSQAQLVMVNLSREDSLLVLEGEERKAQPKTVPRSLVIHFETGSGIPMMRVERVVETNQGKRYQWTEIVRFDGRGPIATRNVTEIKS